MVSHGKESEQRYGLRGQARTNGSLEEGESHEVVWMDRFLIRRCICGGDECRGAQVGFALAAFKSPKLLQPRGSSEAWSVNVPVGSGG